jgi:hypothetical protein
MIRPLVYSTLIATLVGCGPAMMGPSMQMSSMPDMNRMEKKQALMQELMGDPQLPAWHSEREKITQSMGDKIFDKDFDRVFDSLTIALGTLEANVNNMERQSGYITSAVPRLSPERSQQLSKDSMRAYASAKGYDPSLIETKGPYEVDLESMSSFSRMNQAMTISLVKQSPTQTKVKIRFSNINYPPELIEYYKTVWPAIDKQIFLDRNVD